MQNKSIVGMLVVAALLVGAYSFGYYEGQKNAKKEFNELIDWANERLAQKQFVNMTLPHMK